MKQRLFAPIAFSILLVAGVVLYFERPTVGHANVSRVDGSRDFAPGRRDDSLTSSASCVGPRGTNVSRDALNERYRWAHSLLEQRLFDAALPDLKDIARLDPGFPGINQDISTALLQTKHTDQAKEAIDRQISTSECLAKLPVESLDAYCRAEFPQLSIGSCKVRLGQIGQTAQLQAALVHLELGHGMEPDMTPIPVTKAKLDTAPVGHEETARVALKPKKLPSASLELRPPTRKSNSPDGTLMNGAGTDSDLGAYSKEPGKPQ